MLLILSLFSVLQAAATPVAPVPGTWKITGDVVGHPVNEVCTIQQSATALSGSCAMEGGATYDLTGEVRNGRVTFQHGGDYEGRAITIIYSAPLSSAGEMKGTILVRPFEAAGTLTATPVAKP